MPSPSDRSLARRNKPVSGQVEDYHAEEELDEGPLPEDLERFGDVTLNCPECGTEMFDDVAKCWKCGALVQPGTRPNNGLPLWVILTGIALLMAFAMFAMII